MAEMLEQIFNQDKNGDQNESSEEIETKSKKRKGKMGICVECNEEKLCCARNMCNACYIRVVAKPARKQQQCDICGEIKKQFARGVCNACYIRVYKNPKKTDKICIECKESKKVFSRGLCNACYIRLKVKPKKKEICCGECGEMKPQFSRGLCNACYIRTIVKPKRDLEKAQKMSYCLKCCQMDVSLIDGLCKTCQGSSSQNNTNSDEILTLNEGEFCKCHRCEVISINFAKGLCKSCYPEFVSYLKNKVNSTNIKPDPSSSSSISNTQQILNRSNQQIYQTNTLKVKKEEDEKEEDISGGQVANLLDPPNFQVKEEPLEIDEDTVLNEFLEELSKIGQGEGKSRQGGKNSGPSTSFTSILPLDQLDKPVKIFQGISPGIARSLTYKPEKLTKKDEAKNSVPQGKELLEFINKQMKESSMKNQDKIHSKKSRPSLRDINPSSLSSSHNIQQNQVKKLPVFKLVRPNFSTAPSGSSSNLSSNSLPSIDSLLDESKKVMVEVKVKSNLRTGASERFDEFEEERNLEELNEEEVEKKKRKTKE